MDGNDVVSRVGRPSRFMTNTEKNIRVDIIFRYENLNSYLIFLEERFRETLNLQNLNTSAHLEFALSSQIKTRLQEFLTPEYEIYETARTT